MTASIFYYAQTEQTALIIAAIANYSIIVDLLIEAGANLDIQDKVRMTHCQQEPACLCVYHIHKVHILMSSTSLL